MREKEKSVKKTANLPGYQDAGHRNTPRATGKHCTPVTKSRHAEVYRGAPSKNGRVQVAIYGDHPGFFKHVGKIDLGGRQSACSRI